VYEFKSRLVNVKKTKMKSINNPLVVNVFIKTNTPIYVDLFAIGNTVCCLMDQVIPGFYAFV